MLCFREKAFGVSFYTEDGCCPGAFRRKPDVTPALKGYEENSMTVFELGWYHEAFVP